MKMFRGLLPAIAIIVALVASCSDSVPYVLSDKDSAYNLSAPSNLKAVEDAGFVYLTWDSVVGADRYAIYRLTTGQSAFKKIGTVNAEDPSFIYEGTGRAATVGGGNTYLDYVNLDNEFVAGTYQYKVQAQRNVETGVNTDTNDIRYADSPLSSAVSVTIASVPVKGTILPAVTNFSVSDYSGLGTRLQWDMNPLAAYYWVLEYDLTDSLCLESLRSALEVTEEPARSVALWNARSGLTYPDNSDTFNHYSTAVDIMDSGDLSSTLYGVVAVPRDAYYTPISYVAFLDDVELPDPIFVPGVISDIPGNLETIETHETEIILEFDAVAAAETYEVWRSPNGDTDWEQLTTLANDFESVTTDISRVRYHDNYELEAGAGVDNLYYYMVRAVAGSEAALTLAYSDYSNLASGYITTGPGIPSVAQVTGLSASDGEFSSKIELTWTKVDGAEEYIIYRSVDGALTYNLVEQVAVEDLEADADTLFYVDSNVEAGNNVVGTMYYWYKVIAVDTNWGPNALTVYSTFSDANDGHILPNATIVSTDATLAAPSILYYGQGAATTLRIQWTSVLADAPSGALAATGYEVYYSTVDGSVYTLIARTSTSAVTESVLGTSTWLTPVDDGYNLGVSISYTGFENGVPYYFMVKSVNTTESMWSVPSNSTVNWLNGLDTPSITGSFNMTSNTTVIGGDLAVDMTAAITGADVYYLIVSTDNDYLVDGRFVTQLVTEADLLSGDYTHALADLNGETTFYYYVRAYSTDGAEDEESYSTRRSFTTVAAANP